MIESFGRGTQRDLDLSGITFQSLSVFATPYKSIATV
jgi:hypothetical protein